MAHLTEIVVAGVRCYDEYAPQSIQFQKPLTLISGANGSGKTTIIESLRFLTTGEVPPDSSKGQRFLQQLTTGKQSRKATFKLKFRNTEGQLCQIECNPEITRSKTKASDVKYIGGKIDITINEVKKTDMNKDDAFKGVVPKLLGMADECILSDVVFCHQEDSLWPFSHNVKEKFDKIFSTKAFLRGLEAIKDTIDEKTKRLKTVNELIKENEYKREAIITITLRLETLEQREKEVAESRRAKMQTISDLEQEVQEKDALLESFRSKKLGFDQWQHVLLEEDDSMQTVTIAIEATKVQLQDCEKALETRDYESLVSKKNFREERMKSLVKEKNRLVTLQGSIEGTVSNMASVITSVEELKTMEKETHQDFVACEKVLGELIETRSAQQATLQAEKKQRSREAQQKISAAEEKRSIARINKQKIDKDVAALRKNLGAASIEQFALEFADIVAVTTQINAALAPHDMSFAGQSQDASQDEIKPCLSKVESKIRESEHSKTSLTTKEGLLTKDIKAAEALNADLDKFEANLRAKLEFEPDTPLGSGLDDRITSESAKENELDANIKFLETLREQFAADHKCPLCHTQFDSTSTAVNQRIDSIKKSLQKKDTQVRIPVNTLKKYKSDLSIKKAKVLSPAEIGAKRTEMQELTTQIAGLAAEMNGLKEISQHLRYYHYLRMEALQAECAELLDAAELEVVEVKDAVKDVLNASVEADPLLIQLQTTRTTLKKLMPGLLKQEGERNELINAKITDKIAQLETELKDGEALLSNFQDLKSNLDATKNKLLLLQSKSAKLEAKVQFDAQQALLIHRNFTADDLKHDMDRQRKELNRLNAERSESTGEMKEIEKSIKEAKAELARKRTGDNIDDTLKALMIEREVLDMIKNDLDTTKKTLDQAILQYHDDKLKEVNTFIRDLWSKVYRGPDIQSIEIRAEEKDLKSKAYDFKVMILDHSGAEMDMVGRSSAGQRVLASVIIRIALCQVFGCGILALDEPTTNLDESNAKALAEALKLLIEDTKDSLQLIVITHDEEFRDTITQNNLTDCYFQVRKEGTSVIDKKLL